jgi:hypothetical protein
MPPITAWHWIPCPENVTWTCRIPRNAVPYSLVRLAPASAAGPAQGDRPGTPDDIAAAAGWARVTVTAYGRQENRHVAEVTCAWYGSWHTRTVRLILSRDERTASGYDLALITTDLAASPVALVARYAAPWGIEQAFADARNVLAPAKPAAASGAPSSAPSRSPARAHHDRHLVRTATASAPADVDDRRADQPWYRTKTEPAFEDMLIKLRRTMIAARFSPHRPGQPEPGQIRVVLAAWDAATA